MKKNSFIKYFALLVVFLFTVGATMYGQVTIISSAGSGGTISPSGTKTFPPDGSQSQSYSIAANTGYIIGNVLVDGSSVGAVSSYSFTQIHANHTITANFTQQFSLVILINPTNGGSVCCPGSYNSGTYAPAMESPATGYTFTGWSGDASGTSSSINVLMNGNKTVTANFALIPCTISTSSNPSAGGSTSGGGTYNYGTVDTVKATANTGYTFTNWKEGSTVVSTSANYIFTVSANRSLVANFTKNTYVITVQQASGGTITPGTTIVSYGDSLRFSIKPSTGYYVKNIIIDGNLIAADTSYTFKSVASARMISAIFELQPKISLSTTSLSGPYKAGTTSFTITNSGGGTLSWSVVSSDTSWLKVTPKSGTNTGTVTVTYTKDTTARRTGTITVSAAGASNTPQTVTMTQVVQSISVSSSSLNVVNTSGSQSITVSCSGGGSLSWNIASSDTSWLKVTPASGTNTGTVTVTYTTNSSTTVRTGILTVSASNAINTPQNVTVTQQGALTLTLSTTTGGTATKNPNQAAYNYGTSVVLTATPATGYAFTGWSGDTTGTTNPLTVTMNANKNITANFSVIQTLQPPTISIELAGDPVVPGSIVTIKATGNDMDNIIGGYTPSYHWKIGFSPFFKIDSGYNVLWQDLSETGNQIQLQITKIGIWLVRVYYTDDDNQSSEVITRPIIASSSYDIRSMTLNLNGHSTITMHDYISDTINKVWKANWAHCIDTIKKELVKNGCGSPYVSMPQNITHIQYLSRADSCVYVYIWLLNNEIGIDYDILINSCRFDIHFNMVISLKISAQTNLTDSLMVAFDNFQITGFTSDGYSTQPWYQIWYHDPINPSCQMTAGLANIVYPLINNFLLKPSIDKYRNMKFYAPSVKTLAIDYFKLTPDQITEILNSFPVHLILSGDANSNLVMDMNFMEGTQSNPSQFVSVNPQAPANPTFDYLGFACPYYTFQEAFRNWTTRPQGYGDTLAMEKLLLNYMSGYSTPSIRVPISWNEVLGDLPTGSKDTSLLTDAALNAAIQAIPKKNWAKIDSIINQALRMGFDVVPQLMQNGHGLIATMKHKAMAPDYSGAILPDSIPYINVNGNTYLYYAKIFAHAAVRRYANKISLWAIEAELDAAKYNYEAKWWRYGNLWADDNVNGFQDRYWKILVDAVRQEDPTAKLTSPFHILNMVKGLQRFAPDLDFVGVNLYPNCAFAAPVLGSMVGETVWATRRALMGLGLTKNKWGNPIDVHVTETSYPGMIPDPNINPPSGTGILDNIMYYSYGRQSQFMQQAIQTSLAYGAKGFFWWGFLDGDLPNSDGTEPYTNYGSLIVRDTLPIKYKPAASAFKAEADSISVYPGKSIVKLTNKSVTNPNLNGYVALMAERDSLASGDSVYTIKSRNHVSQTYKQVLQGLKHQSWNQISSDFLLKQNFSTITQTTKRDAFFATTAPVTIQATCIEGGAGTSTLGYLDPWYKDGSGNQLNAFRNIILTSSYRDSIFLGQGGQSFTPPCYSVRAPQTINFGGSTGVQNMSLWKWTASPDSSAKFSNSLAQQTGVVFNSSNAVVTANLKGIHLSNDSSAFSNNSQRKLVRTQDGWLHQVYTSMVSGISHVWLEHSTDNGTTWLLGNNGQPLDNGGGKCPSIDWHYNHASQHDYNAIVIVFQQKYGSTYTIQFAIFMNQNGSYVYQQPSYGGTTLRTEPSDPYATTNANPTITWGGSYLFAMSFERKNIYNSMQPGIYWIYGYMYEDGVHNPPNQSYPSTPFAGPILINGTTGNSINAMISLNKQSTDQSIFNIVYQEGSDSIKEVELGCTYNGGNSWSSNQFYSPNVISSASGVLNYKPSMVRMPNYDIRVCWIRSLNGDPVNSPFSVNVVYWNSESRSQYTYFGMGAQSVSLNLRDDNARSFLAWSQNWNNTWSNSLSSGSSYITLGTAGKDVQLSNGPDSSGNTKMYTSAFFPFTLPYYFQNAGAVGSQLQKITPNQITYGRGTVLRKGDVQFNYSLKSLTVDNNNIKFIDIPETPAYKIPDSLSTDRLRTITAMRKWEEENDRYSKLDSLNTVLLSEPFAITGKSSMIFSEQAGFLDTSTAVKALGSNGYIAYKLELIDNAVNKTIAVIKESKFTSASLSPCKLSASNLNVAKVGTKIVRVKITVSTNITNMQAALVSEFGTVDNIALAKSEVKELTLQAPEIIKEYALEQNYPNPFNPTTTIHYQIPNVGHVTLRIYDILGREVATLVDGMEDIGSYSVTFDGGKLASGVYFMRLIAKSDEGKSFVKVKKMVLMK